MIERLFRKIFGKCKPFAYCFCLSKSTFLLIYFNFKTTNVQCSMRFAVPVESRSSVIIMAANPQMSAAAQLHKVLGDTKETKDQKDKEKDIWKKFKLRFKRGHSSHSHYHAVPTVFTVATPTGSSSVTVDLLPDAHAHDVVQLACKQLNLSADLYAFWSDETKSILPDDTILSPALQNSVRIVLRAATERERASSGGKSAIPDTLGPVPKPEERKLPHPEREFIFADVDEGKRLLSLLASEQQVKYCSLPSDSESKNFVKKYQVFDQIENIEINSVVTVPPGTTPPDGPARFYMRSTGSMLHLRANSYKEMRAWINVVEYFQRKKRQSLEKEKEKEKSQDKLHSRNARINFENKEAQSPIQDIIADDVIDQVDTRPLIIKSLPDQLAQTKVLRDQIVEKEAALTQLLTKMYNLDKGIRNASNSLNDELDLNRAHHEAMMQTKQMMADQATKLTKLNQTLDENESVLAKQHGQLLMLKNDLGKAHMVESLFYAARIVARVVLGLIGLYLAQRLLLPFLRSLVL